MSAQTDTSYNFSICLCQNELNNQHNVHPEKRTYDDEILNINKIMFAASRKVQVVFPLLDK